MLAITDEQDLMSMQEPLLKERYEPATQRFPSGCIFWFTNAGPFWPREPAT